jgi:hypothetical protein
MKFAREKSFAKQFMGTLASTVSLTLFPVPYRSYYSVNADIYDSDMRLIKSYKRSAHLTKWVQTFLFVVYPFHPAKRKKEDLYVDFMHDLFRQIELENVIFVP